MNGKIRRKLAYQAADSDILDNRRIHASGDDGAQVLLGLGHFVLENQRVESDIPLDAALVEKLHKFREVGLREIMRPHPGVELLQPEIDCVRAVLNGGPGAFPVSCRGEQFRNP